MPLLRPAALSLVLLLVSATPAVGAGDPVMPLSEVQRGMQCTGYTVLRGTEISSFDARIDDIVYDAFNRADILMTISGPAVDETGAGPGFSGSPIYCPGGDGTPRVAGAIALGIGDYDNKTLLATPIEAMLGEPVVPPSSARFAPRLRKRARPLASPLSVSGLSPPIAEAFSRAAGRAGRVLYAAPSSARLTSFPVQSLKPGSAMAVGYSSGDITLGGVGTATYVDGTSVWGFGHPLDSVGRRSLFLQDAYVYGVISSPSVAGQGTYKLAAPGHDIGTLTGDGASSVTGIVGELPPHFPLNVFANDLDTGATVNVGVQLADEREIGNPTGFSPLGFVGTAAVAQAAYGILHGSPVNTSGDMCVSFKVAERKKAMGFCNTYVAAGTGLAADGVGSIVGTAPVGDFGQAALLLDSYKLGPLHISAINVTLNLRRGLAQAYMVRMSGPRKLTRGKEYRMRLVYKRAGGKQGAVNVKVRVPLRMPRGKRELVLSGTPSDLAGGGSSSILSSLFGSSTDEGGPTSLTALAKQIGGIHRYDGVTASFRPRLQKGETLGPPATPDSLPEGGEGTALRERRVYRNPKQRLSGAVSLRVVVR